MKSILLYLLFLTVLLYFTNSEETVTTNEHIEFECNLKILNNKTYSTDEKKDIKYNVDTKLHLSHHIEKSLKMFSERTCLTFTKSDNFPDPSKIYFENSENCDVDIVLVKIVPAVVVYANQNCIYNFLLEKLIYQAILLKHELFEFIRQKAFNKIACVGMGSQLLISNEKYIKINRSSKILKKVSPTNEEKKHVDYRGISLQAKDFTKELKFKDYKSLNKKVCITECAHKSVDDSICQNDGYIKQKGNDKCVCRRFYTGDTCSDNINTLNHDYCGDYEITANLTEQTKKIDFKETCFHKFKAPNGFKIKFSLFPSIDQSIECLSEPLLEVYFTENNTERGFFPCGKTENLEFTSKSNVMWLFSRKSTANYFYFLTYNSVFAD